MTEQMSARELVEALADIGWGPIELARRYSRMRGRQQLPQLINTWLRGQTRVPPRVAGYVRSVRAAILSIYATCFGSPRPDLIQPV